jgi:glycosyltransferase involved in cell wall biosynthesis
MDYHANVAGALTLARAILPLVWERDPSVRLTIAGGRPPAAVRRLARDRRVTVSGYTADLRPLIGAAQIAVSPLPYAVGIQNKILEAMALGTPVVASSTAAAGLHAVPGRDLLVAETPDEFAGAVLRLLDDAQLRQALAERGLRYIATHHDWPTVIGQLTSVYERARRGGRGIVDASVAASVAAGSARGAVTARRTVAS